MIYTQVASLWALVVLYVYLIFREMCSIHGQSRENKDVLKCGLRPAIEYKPIEPLCCVLFVEVGVSRGYNEQTQT